MHIEPPFPTVSFTFDGFTRSAARTAAPLLEHAGGRGTFYASSAEAGQHTALGEMFCGEDVVRLASSGHELGCGTFGKLDCARIGRDDFLEDIVQNGAALGALGFEGRLEACAYPFGRVGTGVRMALPSRYLSGRGMMPSLASGSADLTCLRANAMFGVGALQRCLDLLERARRTKGWVIFYAHDVAARPSPWGAPTGLLERLVGAAYSSGMRIMTVSAAITLAAQFRGEAPKTPR